MTLKTLIYKLLVKYPELRDSDRLLVWKVWELQGIAGEQMSKYDFISKAEHFEAIRRTRQKVNEEYPETRSSKRVQEVKDELAEMKGAFIPYADTNVDWEAMRQEVIDVRKKADDRPQGLLF